MPEQVDEWFAPKPVAPAPVLTIPEIRTLLQKMASVLVATSTGGLKIQDVQKAYTLNAATLDANLTRLGIENPFPWADLWEWFGHYKAETDQYWQRRELIKNALTPALSSLADLERTGEVHDPAPDDDSPTWLDLNVRIAALVKEYSSARDKDTWQDVGRRSREILIDLGKLIASAVSVPEGEEPPKGADARKWFELFLADRAQGRDKSELRAMLRSTWDLAQKVTHGNIDDVDAFASAQATVLLVRTSQKLL